MTANNDTPQIFIRQGGTYPSDAVRVNKVEDGIVHFHPEGGGFSYSTEQEKFNEMFRAFDPAIDVRQWRRASICVDDFPSIQGFLDDRRWNGGEMPAFTKEVIDAAMHGDGVFSGIDIKYVPEKDAYEVRMEGMGDDDESDVYVGTEIQVDGESVHVYAIGAGGWCWEEDIAPDNTPQAPR